MSNEALTLEEVEPFGISAVAYEEIISIVGHTPSIDEVSTLLAIWESNGKQQSLLGWLKGQQHSIIRNDYLYEGRVNHLEYSEPKIVECRNIAHSLAKNIKIGYHDNPLSTGALLYMVGNISSEFADGEYARQCLHIAQQPMAMSDDEEGRGYILMIVEALKMNDIVLRYEPLEVGGLFFSLARLTTPRGYDILAPREVRLDAFLFGEERSRYLVAIEEKEDDTFLKKLSEAHLNCCFLGRTTKDRVVVDGYDFGLLSEYFS